MVVHCGTHLEEEMSEQVFTASLTNGESYRIVAMSRDHAVAELTRMGLDFNSVGDLWYEAIKPGEAVFMPSRTRLPMLVDGIQLFHGGCHGCTRQHTEGTRGCRGCKFYNCDWTLPSLNNEEEVLEVA